MGDWGLGQDSSVVECWLATVTTWVAQHLVMPDFGCECELLASFQKAKQVSLWDRAKIIMRLWRSTQKCARCQNKYLAGREDITQENGLRAICSFLEELVRQTLSTLLHKCFTYTETQLIHNCNSNEVIFYFGQDWNNYKPSTSVYNIFKMRQCPWVPLVFVAVWCSQSTNGKIYLDLNHRAL